MTTINLIPAGYRKSKETSGWKTAAYAIVPVAVLAALIPSLILQSQLSGLQAQIDENSAVVTRLAPVRREVTVLTRQRNDLAKVAQVALALQATKTYWSTDLARFINALPQSGGVAISSLTMRSLDASAQTNNVNQGLYNGKLLSREFELAGNAASSAAMVSFLKTFETDPQFGVNFRGIQRAAAAGAASTAKPGTEEYAFTATVGMTGAPVSASLPTPAGSAAPSAPPAPVGSPVRPTPGQPTPGQPTPGQPGARNAN